MSDAKRIVLAVTLAEQGGVQEFLLKFASHLLAQGHEVTLIAGEGSWLFEQAAAKGIPMRNVKHLGRSIRVWRDVRAFFAVRSVLRELQPDAIHLNSTKMGVLGAFAARSVGIKRVVYRIGGWVFLEPLSPLVKMVYRFIERLSAAWKDYIVCVHPGDLRVAEALNILPRKQLKVIPNGIDLDVFRGKLLSRKEARAALIPTSIGETPLFGTIANFFPAKDLLGYLDACTLVHKRFPEALFVLIGDGPERLAFEEKRRALHLEQVVLLPGQLPQASRFLKAFDVFVLPSAKEGMSWALLEAMAASLPCLATQVGANEWLLAPDAGVLVPALDPKTLAERMCFLLESRAVAAAYGVSACARIERDFPLRTTLEENEKILLSP